MEAVHYLKSFTAFQWQNFYFSLIESYSIVKMMMLLNVNLCLEKSAFIFALKSVFSQRNYYIIPWNKLRKYTPKTSETVYKYLQSKKKLLS